ncbi:MAG: hypothetical protein Q9181_000838 [Wetmoreana brouardii]
MADRIIEVLHPISCEDENALHVLQLAQEYRDKRMTNKQGFSVVGCSENTSASSSRRIACHLFARRDIKVSRFSSIFGPDPSSPAETYVISSGQKTPKE